MTRRLLLGHRIQKQKGGEADDTGADDNREADDTCNERSGEGQTRQRLQTGTRRKQKFNQEGKKNAVRA